MTGRTWELRLPFTVPLSMNADRGHWAKRHRLTAPWRDAALVLARAQRIPKLARFTVVLHYAPREARRRDPENLTATLKPIVDGLVRAGVAADDCPPFYVPNTPVIHPPTGEPGRVWIVVEELPDA